jgi:hypothetical protein
MFSLLFPFPIPFPFPHPRRVLLLLRFHFSPSSDSFAQLVVISQNIANDSAKIWKGRVSKPIFNKFRALADKEDLYSLPSRYPSLLLLLLLLLLFLFLFFFFSVLFSSFLLIFPIFLSNYDEDLSDDCFHLGASVEVRFKSRATYKHKIPTGSCVVVTGVQTQQQHQSRFLNFVRGACNLVEGIMSSSSSPQGMFILFLFSSLLLLLFLPSSFSLLLQ